MEVNRLDIIWATLMICGVLFMGFEMFGIGLLTLFGAFITGLANIFKVK